MIQVKILNKLSKRFLLLILITATTSCATKEYLAAKEQCAPSAYQQYPVNNAQVLATRYQQIQVPTGGMNCQSYANGNGGVNTNCMPQMRYESIPYQSMEIVDQNAEPRSAAIKACAQQSCFEQFGNGDCKK